MAKRGKWQDHPGRESTDRYIVVPAAIAGDDRFPFKDEKVAVTIDEGEKTIRVDQMK